MSHYYLRPLDDSLNFGGNVCGKQLLNQESGGGTEWLGAMLKKAPSLNRNDSGYMLTAPRITFKIFQDPKIKYF